MYKHYAKAGGNFFQTLSNHPGEGWLEVPFRETSDVICQDNGDGTGSWVEPEETSDYKHFTGLAKLDLFTPSEQQAVIAAVYGGDAEVAVFYERFKIADYVTYSNPETELGLQLLVVKGLIMPERKNDIVAVMTAERHL